MNNLGLLAMGRSFAGGRKKATPFRVDGRGLPRFNDRPAEVAAGFTTRTTRTSTNNDFSGTRTADGSQSPALPRRLPGGGPPSFLNPPAGTPPTAQAPARTKGAGDSFWARRWFRRKRETGWVLEELSLSDVRVVRNDLRDADVEVLAPASPSGRNGRPLRLAVAEWGRWMGALLRMGQ